jgi:hypothetical protein
LDCAPEEREAFLKQACEGDSDLKTQIEKKLAGTSPGGHRVFETLLAGTPSVGHRVSLFFQYLYFLRFQVLSAVILAGVPFVVLTGAKDSFFVQLFAGLF